MPAPWLRRWSEDEDEGEGVMYTRQGRRFCFLVDREWLPACLFVCFSAAVGAERTVVKRTAVDELSNLDELSLSRTKK